MQHEDRNGAHSKRAEAERVIETPLRRPGRGDRFGSEAARMIYTAALELDEPDLHDLVRELAVHVATPEVRGSPQKRRVARAVAALREGETIKREQGDDSPLSVDT